MRNLFQALAGAVSRPNRISFVLAVCLGVLSFSVGARETPRPFSAPVTIAGKQFVQAGNEVILNGINYFPAYFPPILRRSWLDTNYYRPEMIEDDLSTLQNLGFNLVSIQGLEAGVMPSEQNCANLRDFLNRAQTHGMLVNLYIGSSSIVPLANPGRPAETPRICKLSGHPALFAYDIAWEPHFGDESQRQALWPRWTKWLEAAYGSLDKADAAFGGGHDLPSDIELCGNTPNVKVASFRRFLDDVLSASYRDIRSAILKVDSTHLIGVRSGFGGNGARNFCRQAPVDLRAGAKHLDFISPEAYALPKTDKLGLLNRGGFTAAYADMGKPLFWAEFGNKADNSCPTCTESIQTSFFSDMFELMRKSASNGGAGWWYVGIRPQTPDDKEKSDYGIIYDYLKHPSAKDASGDPLRDGRLSLCAEKPNAYGLYVGYDDNSSKAFSCPSGLESRGKFRVYSESPGGKNGLAKDGRSVSSGWMMLCGKDDNALLSVSPDDNARDEAKCPAGYEEAGSFKPGSKSAGGGEIAVDAFGRSLDSGWVRLCTRTKSVLLKRTRNEMSGRTMSCPSGLTDAGSFKPQTLPVFRPVASLFKDALAGVSASQRIYSKWITVDRDAAAGDWRMYEAGTKAYAEISSGGQRVGVRTPCTGTTSREVRFCVGNTPFNGACPAKCLNAEWNSVQIQDADGVWQTVADQGKVTVKRGVPVHARLSIGNTGEGKWLSHTSAGGIKGSVRFACNENVGDIGCRHEVPSDVEMFEDADSGDIVISKGISKKTNVVFQMNSEQVAWFGGQLRVLLTPRPDAGSIEQQE